MITQPRTAALAFLLAIPSVASASPRPEVQVEDEDDSTDGDEELGPNAFEAHPFAINYPFGLGTPTGYVGVEAEWSPVSWLGLTLGGGIGDSGRQVAFMAHWRRFISDTQAWSLGTGLSYGPYHYEQPLCGIAGSVCNEWSGNIVWANIEGAYERKSNARSAGAMTFRSFLGVGVMLNPGALACSGPCDGFAEPTRGDASGLLLYFGFAPGIAF